ncbi:MAG: hypothetical protein ABI351_05680 [Herbaspirillum sp.]
MVRVNKVDIKIVQSALCAVVLCCLGVGLPAIAEDTDALTVTPVLYVFESLGSEQKVADVCWQTLITERQLMLREEQSRPWLLRNAIPLIGAAMGVASGSYLLRRHGSALNIKRWLKPAMLGGGLFGFAFGPAGVVGGFAGGLLGDRFGKHKFPIILASSLLGAAAGKKLWDMVFPPISTLEDNDEDPDDMPVETFLREKTCGAVLNSEYGKPHYRVVYQFDGEQYTTDLPYDPGEALLLDGTGKIQGPARSRAD